MEEKVDPTLRAIDIFSDYVSPPSETVIKVLHVDDESDVLLITKLTLEKIDPSLQVESVSSPEEAISRLKIHKFDCVVSDYKMPQMNGIELAIIIKKSMNIPFIIYTSRGSEEVAEATFSAGVDDYIRKEFEIGHYSILAKRIKSVVEKYKAENRLISSFQTSAGIVESIPSGLFIYQFEPPDRLVLQYGNPEAERLIGIDINEWLGKEFEEIWPYDKKIGLKENYINIIKKDTKLSVDNLYWNDDIVEGYFNIRAFKIARNKLVVAFENITERVQFEESLRENAKHLEEMMEEKNQQIIEAERMIAASKDASRMIHDLMRTLQTIVHSAYIMRRMSRYDDKVLEIMDVAAKEAERLLDDLYYTILRSSLQIEDTDIRALIMSVLDEASLLSSISLEINVKNELTAPLDREKIKQVLDNLVKNAVLAMRQGGTLSISAERIVDSLQIEVGDTGIGISDEKIPEIFKPFYITKPESTGQGLTYCKRAVEAHGGIITVVSKEGKGTNFIINLPYKGQVFS